MGFIFGKNKSKPAPEGAEEAAPVRARPTGAPQRGGGAVTRQSRRVVAAPGAKGPVKPSTAPAPTAPAPEPALDADELSLAAPAPAPAARPATTAPITSSAPPVFTGSLGASGPVRTGDAALIDFLVVQAKLITAEQAQAAQKKAQADGVPLDTALIAGAGLTEDAILNALSQARYFPHLQLDRYAIRKKALDTVTREDALRLSVLPVDKLGSLLQLAMVNPLDEETVALIHSRTGLEVKRCIATRSELQRGIDKWYGGQVQAQDTSISFTADPTQETRSVTQVLGNVPVKAPPAPTQNIVPDLAPEIQDIDDLLSSDEVIAPAIIEPIHLDEPPLVVPASEVVEIAEPEPAAALEPRHRRESVVVEDDAHELALDEVPITKPVTRKPAAPAAAPQGQVFVQMVPVLEDEFKHAITHGKAHVFEKWVGLQTRNRIINAVPVDAPFDHLLAGLAAEAA